MNIIDHIFLAVFNRYRRERGRSLDSAWRAAEYQVVSYLTWPVIVVVISAFLVLWPAHRAATSMQRHAAQIMTVAVGLIVAYMLHRRFKRFLLAPPVLPEAEASDDARLVFAFRLFTAGLFVVGCAVAYFVGGSYRV